MLRLESTRYCTVPYSAVHTVLFECIYADGKRLETAYTAILDCDIAMDDSEMDGDNGYTDTDDDGDCAMDGGGDSYIDGR